MRAKKIGTDYNSPRSLPQTTKKPTKKPTCVGLLLRRESLLLAQHPCYEGLDAFIADRLACWWHRHRAKRSFSAITHFQFQRGLSCLVVLVFRSNILER